MTSRVTRSRSQLPPPQQPEQQSRARWTNGLTKILADLMVDQVREGNRHNNSFTGQSWQFMCEAFYQKTGLKWDQERLKSRFAAMRKQHAVVKSLLDCSSFSFDERTGTIKASNEAWADYIKGHPDAESIRGSGCPFYRQLCLIFSDTVTNGKHDQSAEPEGGTPSLVTYVEPLNSFQVVEFSAESEESDDMADEQDTVQPLFMQMEPDTTQPAAQNKQETVQPAMPNTLANRKRDTVEPAISSHKRGRRGVDDAIAQAILHMAAASKLRTAVVRQINARYSIADCIKQLDEMQGVEEVYFAALDLFNKPSAREIFLSLKGDKRLIWLRAKCTKHKEC